MISLYTRHVDLAKLLNAAMTEQRLNIPTRKTPKIEYLPNRADFVVTVCALSSEFERFALRLHAVPLVIPESLPWLVEQLRQRNKRSMNTVIIGHDYVGKWRGMKMTPLDLRD